MRIQRISVAEEEQLVKENDDIDLSVLDPLIEKYKNIKGNVIPLLQGTQQQLGYIPREAFEKISRETGLDLTHLYGVATFYAQFRLTPVGKHIIKVCHGTACHVQGAENITDALEDSLKVKDGETTEDGIFTLESVACLGCCSLAPVMMIGEETYGKLSRDKSVKVIKNIRLHEQKSKS